MMIRVKNSAEGAEISISGNIIDDQDGNLMEWWMGEGNTGGYEWPSNIKKQLDDIDDGQPLTVYINSDGGSVAAGMAIANMIARHKGPTTAVVDGWACSIATQIFFAADTCRIPSNAYLMLHKPSCALRGDADDLAKGIEMLDAIQAGLESTYNKAAKDGVTPEQVHDMVEQETWLTGESAAQFFNVEVMEATKTAASVSNAFLAAADTCKTIPQKIRDLLEQREDSKPNPDAEEEKRKTMNMQVAIALALAEGE
nr:MAG TPA: Putative ATP dependent Clp protease [Caudoviricetes sp.]